MGPKDGSFQVVSGGVGCSEDVANRGHGIKVQSHSRELVFNLSLGLIEGMSSRHLVLRFVRKAPNNDNSRALGTIPP